MKIETTSTSPAEIKADAVVIGIRNDNAGKPMLDGPIAILDSATDGAISRLIQSNELSADELSITTLLAPAGVAAPVVVIAGQGSADEDSAELAYRVAGAVAKQAAAKARPTVAFYIDTAFADHAVCGAITGCVGQDICRQELKIHPPETLYWANTESDSIERGQKLGDAMNLTRQLVNLPANKIYPETFADQCVKAGKESGFEVEVWDEKKLEQERCGALLSVAQGSDRPARLVIMRYRGGLDEQKPLGLVGKGVTFDSGGLSLKPSESMLTMKCDMAGAATVVGAMSAIAQMKLPVNVNGLVGLAENMISGNSYRLGDVLTSRNGKTIEVHNTDAEGRLVLADTLDVAVETGVGKLIDLATLTGACVVALGTDITGLMSNDNSWSDAVCAAADECGERVWPLPMHAEFADQIKSKVADIKNLGEGRWGGAITAGKFLEEFVRGTPWVHLDIAGPSFADKPAAWIDAGASGCMVRTLVEVARVYK